MTIHAAPTTLDSIKNSLVALRMPRALEVLDATLRRIEQGEIDGIEALDQLLVEELIQIEGSSYRLRQHADLVPEHVRSKAHITPPPAPKRRGRPPTPKADDQNNG